MNKKSSFQLNGLPIIKDLQFSRVSNTLENQNPKINITISSNSKKVENKNEGIVELDIKLNSLEIEFFELQAKIVANFFWTNDAKDEEVESFLNRSASAIVLSYIRPVISNITTYAGLPPFIIPFLDLRK